MFKGRQMHRPMLHENLFSVVRRVCGRCRRMRHGNTTGQRLTPICPFFRCSHVPSHFSVSLISSHLHSSLSSPSPSFHSFSPMDSNQPSDAKPLNVLIVGAGLAGLLFAIVLDRAGIPYQIYERAAIVKPLGTYPNLLLSPLDVLHCCKLICLFYGRYSRIHHLP